MSSSSRSYYLLLSAADGTSGLVALLMWCFFPQLLSFPQLQPLFSLPAAGLVCFFFFYFFVQQLLLLPKYGLLVLFLTNCSIFLPFGRSSLPIQHCLRDAFFSLLKKLAKPFLLTFLSCPMSLPFFLRFPFNFLPLVSFGLLVLSFGAAGLLFFPCNCYLLLPTAIVSSFCSWWYFWSGRTISVVFSPAASLFPAAPAFSSLFPQLG
ncbi:hypothetical protein ACOSQ2_019342 [Xanthoceras sorbifolium]